MSALSLRLPSSIHQHIREIAKNEGVSINLFPLPYLKKFLRSWQKII